MTISEKIKELRFAKRASQYEIADKLGMSRTTYVLIEAGKKQLTIPELQRLTAILGSSLEEMLFNTAQIPAREAGIEKYKQIILNCLQFGGDSSDGKITKSKLAKLVYLVDFSWFYKNLKPMSGLSYRRIDQGPVPDQYFRVIDELFEEGAISIDQKNVAIMIRPIENTAPKNQLSNGEIELIQKISRQWKDKNTREIVDFTHQQIPWKVCRPGEIIPYELITQEDPENVCG